MKINKAYKTELDPNNRQRSALFNHADAAKKAWNWGLRRRIDHYQETGKSLSAIDLHKELNQLKKLPKEEGGFPWMRETSKCAPQEALRNLDAAYDNFFRRVKENKAAKAAGRKPRWKKLGFPRFKSKKRWQPSFRVTGAIHVKEKSIQLPRLGIIRLKEKGYLPTPDRKDVKILSATVTEKTGRWYVSLSVEETIPDPPTPTGPVQGVDLGIKNWVVLSDTTVFGNLRTLKNAERNLRSSHKAVSRKVKGSKNQQKAYRRLAERERRVSNIRKDAIQKLTSIVIAKRPMAICLETLNIAGMLRNHNLAKSLADAALGEIQRCLKYKSEWATIPVYQPDQWYPSSKKCSTPDCPGIKENLTLKDRIYHCAVCGLTIDRDLNAALNLQKYAIDMMAKEKLAASLAVTACCPDLGILGSADVAVSDNVKLLIGQEPNINQCP